VSLDATEAGASKRCSRKARPPRPAERVKRAEPTLARGAGALLDAGADPGSGGQGAGSAGAASQGFARSFTTPRRSGKPTMQLPAPAPVSSRKRAQARTDADREHPCRSHQGVGTLDVGQYLRPAESAERGVAASTERARDLEPAMSVFAWESRPYTSRWETWPGPAPSSRRASIPAPSSVTLDDALKAHREKDRRMGREALRREQLLGPQK